MAVYPITRYPSEIKLRDGTQVVVRPMTPDDCRGIHAFFSGISEEERFFLKEDVCSATVIQAWADHLDYDRALPLLALADGNIVGDAVLIRHRGGYRSHGAEIRVVVAQEFRGKGLGLAMLRELVEIAWDAELDEVHFELVADVQDDALKAVQFLGGVKAGQISDAVRDTHGDLHDIVFLRLPLGNYWKLSQF
jgi:L-amino acid N-acyltransferase YncA